MRRTAILASLCVEMIRRIRHFGDFVTVPLAIVVFVRLAGGDRLHLVAAGVALGLALDFLGRRWRKAE